MNLLFIKKTGNSFDYAMTTNDWKNNNHKTLKEYSFSESDLQSISNGKFLIFYDRMYKLEQSFAKMFFEDMLKDKADISMEELRYDLTLGLKQLFIDCKRLCEGNKEKDERDHMIGEIIIVSSSGMYHIVHNFSVEKLDSYLNRNEPQYLAECEIIGDKPPIELIEVYMKQGKKNNGYLNYPLIYGSTESNKVSLKDINNNQISIEKENFVCRW